MKYARIPFNVQFMYYGGGMERDLMIQMLTKLPPDAKILGFGRVHGELIEYMFIGSNYFKDVPEGTMPPDIQVFFRTDEHGRSFCESIDASAARPPAP